MFSTGRFPRTTSLEGEQVAMVEDYITKLVLCKKKNEEMPCRTSLAERTARRPFESGLLVIAQNRNVSLG